MALVTAARRLWGGDDSLSHVLVALDLLLIWHVQRVVDGLCESVGVEGVDEDGARAERLRGADKL